jgi:hypothetical protein
MYYCIEKPRKGEIKGGYSDDSATAEVALQRTVLTTFSIDFDALSLCSV